MTKKFLTPSTKNYPAVYWFWHHIPSPEEIQKQLREISDAGFKTFLIQARLALPLDKFLSQEYLNAYRYAMNVARELNLVAGLYDDYNWISGHGGGRTVQGHDELREQHLFWSSSLIEGSKTHCSISGIKSMLVQGLDNAGLEWIYEDGEMRWGNWRIIKCLLYPNTQEDISYDQVVDLTDRSTIIEQDGLGCKIAVDCPTNLSGEWVITAFIAGKCITSRLINYLMREASERFIEVAYEPFSETMSEYFGDPLKFAFFDHPYSGFYSWNEQHGNIKNTLMFSDSLFSRFLEQNQYPIEEALWGSICADNTLSSRYRCDLFDIYSKLGIESFFKPVSDWTKRHGLDLAGHELLGYIGGWGFTGGFGWVDNRVNFGGNYFLLDSYRTITTVDAFNSQAQISAKMGDSVAKANDRRGCMIEQYYVSRDPDRPGAIGQWDLTFNEYRTQAIRHYFLGASKFLYHGFYLEDGDDCDYSLFSNPRFDFAPAINFEPWFPIHKSFGEEMARLSTFLSEGEPIIKIAILYPLRTYWAKGGNHPMEAESAAWNSWLTQNGLGFDVIDEINLIEGKVHGNQIEICNRRYRCVILPGVSTVYSRDTIKKIGEFIKNHGIVFASGPLTNSAQLTGFDETLEEEVTQYFEDHPSAYYFPTLTDENESMFRQIHEVLKAAIPEYPIVQVQDDDEAQIWLNSYKISNGALIAVFNDSQKPRAITLRINNKLWFPSISSTSSGEVRQYGWFDFNNEGTNIYLKILPSDYSLLQLMPGTVDTRPHLLTSSINVIKNEISNKDELIVDLQAESPGFAYLEVFSKSPPKLSVDFDKKILRNEEHSWLIEFQVPDLPIPIELNKGWIFSTEDTAKKEDIDIHVGWEEQGYPGYSGIGYYEIEFDITEDDMEINWELVFDRVETVAEVLINGISLGSCTKPPYQIIIEKNKLVKPINILQVKVYNTAGNRYYYNTPFAKEKPIPSGIIGVPKLVPKFSFQLTAE